MIIDKIKQIKVLYRDYSVIPFDGEEHGAFGQYSKKKERIYLDPDMSPQLKLDTLFHEMGHAIDYEFKITGQYDWEHFANSFSTAMFGLFRDNPLLVQAAVEIMYPKNPKPEPKKVTKKVTEGEE